MAEEDNENLSNRTNKVEYSIIKAFEIQNERTKKIFPCPEGNFFSLDSMETEVLLFFGLWDRVIQGLLT